MDNDLNIIIVGVGGQGILLTNRILGRYAMKTGRDVKISEVHGMSQRGGSVVSYVKIGSNVHSPVIEDNSADIMLAFEELEALRWLGRLRRNGLIIVNSQNIDPMPVIMRRSIYPENILELLKGKTCDVISVDALSKAKEAGSTRAVNIVMLGKMSKILDIERALFIDIIKETVPERYIDLNIKAFDSGYM